MVRLVYNHAPAMKLTAAGETFAPHAVRYPQLQLPAINQLVVR